MGIRAAARSVWRPAGAPRCNGARAPRHDSIEIGNIPSFLTSPAETFVNSALDDVLNGVNLDHKYAPTLTDGQAAIAGIP